MTASLATGGAPVPQLYRIALINSGTLAVGGNSLNTPGGTLAGVALDSAYSNIIHVTAYTAGTSSVIACRWGPRGGARSAAAAEAGRQQSMGGPHACLVCVDGVCARVRAPALDRSRARHSHQKPHTHTRTHKYKNNPLFLRFASFKSFAAPTGCAVTATVSNVEFRGITVLNGKLILGDATTSKVWACDYTSANTVATTAVSGCAPLSPAPTVPTTPLAVAAAAV